MKKQYITKLEEAIEIIDGKVEKLVTNYIVNQMDKPTSRFVNNSWKIIKEKLLNGKQEQ